MVVPPRCVRHAGTVSRLCAGGLRMLHRLTGDGNNNAFVLINNRSFWSTRIHPMTTNPPPTLRDFACCMHCAKQIQWADIDAGLCPICTDRFCGSCVATTGVFQNCGQCCSSACAGCLDIANCAGCMQTVCVECRGTGCNCTDCTTFYCVSCIEEPFNGGARCVWQCPNFETCRQLQCIDCATRACVKFRCPTCLDTDLPPAMRRTTV